MGVTSYKKHLTQNDGVRYFEFEFDSLPIDAIHGMLEADEDTSGMVIEITPKSDAEKAMLHEILAHQCFTAIDDGDGSVSCLIGSATEAYNLAKVLQEEGFLPKDRDFLIDFTAHVKSTGKLPIEMHESTHDIHDYDDEDVETPHAGEMVEGIHIDTGTDVVAPIENYGIPFRPIPKIDEAAIEFACVPILEALRPPRRGRGGAVQAK